MRKEREEGGRKVRGMREEREETTNTLPSRLSSHLPSQTQLISAHKRNRLDMKLSPLNTLHNFPFLHNHYSMPTCSISCGLVLLIPASLAMAEYRSVTLEERGRE